MRFHARGRGAPRQAQAMHLANHRIARHATKPASNLAGAQSVRPQLLQQFDPFVIPGHTQFSRSCDSGGIHDERTESGHHGRSWAARSSAHLSRQREPDRPTINATGNCEGLVLWTRRRQKVRRYVSGPAATRPIASTRDLPWTNARETTTPLTCASSGRSADRWQCLGECDSITTESHTTCELRG